MYGFTIYAPAKLNLYLDVLEKRADGYYNIKTLFEKIDLKDEIIVREAGEGLMVRAEPQSCPSGEGNIVYKALQVLCKEANVDLGLQIFIKKKIPLSSGLGGGSSDAGAILRSVNERFKLGVSEERLFSIAATIGKDVPFFMLDVPFAIGSGTGEELEPIDIDIHFSHIIIKPHISISTAQMYERLDGYQHKPRQKDINDIVSALKREDIKLIRQSYYNIFEEVLAEDSYLIERARSLLVEAGAGPTFLSGSGPSVFCTLKDRERAIEILKRIPREKDMDIFLVTTYKGGHLWR